MYACKIIIYTCIVNHVYMQDKYVYMQDNYAYMHDNYVYIQDNYVYMYRLLCIPAR